MSIVVESTSLSDQAPAVQAKSGQLATAEVKKEVTSAPEAEQAAEQKESPESDTEETEAKAETESESEDEDSDEETEAKDSDQDKPKKKSGSQRRKERAERAEAEVDRLRRMVENMALKGAGESNTPKVESPKASDPAGKPNPDSYDTHTEYVEALTDWKLEQRDNAKKIEAHKSQLQIQQETILKAHNERITAFKEKTADFDEAIEEVGDAPVSPTVQELIYTSENGPALMYALAKNKAEFERINKLTPLAAARAMGIIEAGLSASSETKTVTKKQTKAPAPLTPVGSKGSAVVKTLYDEDLSQREFEALRARKRQA